MNLIAFILILIVGIVIKNELLTYALIVWGSVLLFRLVIHMLLDNARADVKFGRASNWRQ